MNLSVIIPVYQTVATLERCVGSVTAHPCPNDMEVILVDDGSTDGAALMCDRLSSADNRIRVIHKPNGGLSSARNTGLEASTGRYIAFIDSDDEFVSGTLMQNMESLTSDNSIDMIEFPVSVHHGSDRQYLLKLKPRIVGGSNVLPDWIRRGGNYHAYAWNKIYRRELFDGIRFPEGETFEDIAIMPGIIGRCRKIRYSNRGLYLYHDNGDGITAHYRFGCQEPLFRHNLELLEKSQAILPARHRVALWCCCLNLLADLCRCLDADNAYIANAAASLDGLRPSWVSLPFSGIEPKAFVKYIAAATFGSEKFCMKLGEKKLPS